MRGKWSRKSSMGEKLGEIEMGEKLGEIEMLEKEREVQYGSKLG